MNKGLRVNLFPFFNLHLYKKLGPKVKMFDINKEKGAVAHKVLLPCLSLKL